jgi:flavin reductase (DIM6/NTAB) family NADH-FMN oxidoreductase RutF
MHWTKEDLIQMERIERLNLVNSIGGVKPANLIGTISNEGETNLSIFNSVVHLGSSPALMGFIVRPPGEVRRHTYENIRENGSFTINMIHPEITKQAHYTSAKFEASESEFEACGLTEKFLFGFPAPFVHESRLKIGLNYLSEIPILINGTKLIIGQIEYVMMQEEVLFGNNHLDLEKLETVGIGGLNTYYTLKKIDHFPYAKRDALPDFSQKK